MNVLQGIGDSLFGKRKTPAELLRKHQRQLDGVVRELNRERTKAQLQDKKLVADIQKSAKAGETGSLAIQAKDLVRTRNHEKKLYQMQTQIKAISFKLQTIRGNDQMVSSMRQVAGQLNRMSRHVRLPELQKIVMEFERESDMMDQRQEMMDDAMDDLTGIEDEAETEDVINQVMDELGLDLKQLLPSVVSGPTGAQTAGPERVAMGADGDDPGDDDMRARLEKLKK